MNKFLSVLILSLFFINSVNAKQIYLECKRSEKEKDKENVTRVNITEYIFDKRKVTLKEVMADGYYEIKQIDGSITKQQQMFFPMTNIDKLPMTKIDEDDTYYYLGGQLFGYQKKTYEEILRNNEKNSKKMQYSTLKLNKYTLDMIYTSYYYPHTYEQMFNQNYKYPETKTVLKKIISKTPHKCRIIKNKI